MKEKKLTDENYKKILDGVMEQAEKDFGEVVVENMFGEAVIDTLKEMAIKHSNDSYVYRVLVNAINLIQDLKAENESFGKTINQASETLKKQKAEIERLTEEANQDTVTHIDICTQNLSLRKQNAELQKQVDELKEELEKAYEIERANIQAEIAEAGTSCQWCKNVTVKDTAREIYSEIFESCVFKFKGNEDYKKGFCDALEQYDKQLRELAKQKGVEVE